MEELNEIVPRQTLLPPAARRSRFETSADVPTHQHLADIKYKKKLLIKGAEQFNVKPNSGIQFLQENKLLQEPLDATQVVILTSFILSCMQFSSSIVEARTGFLH